MTIITAASAPPPAGPGFIWLASYPKSGNTWMRMALNCLDNDGRPLDINNLEGPLGDIAASRTGFDRWCDIDSTDLGPDEILAARPHAFRLMARGLKQPVFKKAHEAFVPVPGGGWLFPADATVAAIYMVRDPRDVAISYAHHLGRSVDEAIARMADPAHDMVGRDGGNWQLPQPVGSWSQHVESWLDRPPFPVLLVRYEDMLADLAAILRPVMVLAGRRVGGDRIDRAVQATRFDALRAQEQQHGFRERSLRTQTFFRQGRAGGWRDTLSPAQVARIEADHATVMARLGYHGAP